MIRASLINRDQRGVAALEFGILCMPLTVALLGFLDLGYESYVRSQLQGALNKVAREASVEHPNIGDSQQTIETQIQNRVKDRMAPLVKSGTYTFTISSYDNFSSVGKAEALITDKNGNGKYDPGDCWQDSNPNGVFDSDSSSSGVGNADDVVVYSVNIKVPRLTPVGKLIGASDPFDVDAKSIVRRQPFADQPKPPTVC
jgi:Flp pilus assembly protein TadG